MAWNGLKGSSSRIAAELINIPDFHEPCPHFKLIEFLKFTFAHSLMYYIFLVKSCRIHEVLFTFLSFMFFLFICFFPFFFASFFLSFVHFYSDFDFFLMMMTIMMTMVMMMMMTKMNCFCGMVDRRKALSLISSRDHYQKSSPSRISDTPAHKPEFRLCWIVGQ